MTPAICTCLAVLALAAPAPPPRPGAAPAPASGATPAPTAASEGDAAAPSTGATDPNAGEPTPSADKVTRYSFTGLDIDGELRTPALLQFLARIAGEFETLGIPHRSFMPELRATVGEDAL
jgi:hypothetical protein